MKKMMLFMVVMSLLFLVNSEHEIENDEPPPVGISFRSSGDIGSCAPLVEYDSIRTHVDTLSCEYLDFMASARAAAVLSAQITFKKADEAASWGRVVIHGCRHFVREFTPTNPFKNPQEFVSKALMYGGYTVFYYLTGGIVHLAEKIETVGMKIHALMQIDIYAMTALEQAECIAENAAELIKWIFADKLGQKLLPAVPLPEIPTGSAILECAKGFV